MFAIRIGIFMQKSVKNLRKIFQVRITEIRKNIFFPSLIINFPSRRRQARSRQGSHGWNRYFHRQEIRGYLSIHPQHGRTTRETRRLPIDWYRWRLLGVDERRRRFARRFEDSRRRIGHSIARRIRCRQRIISEFTVKASFLWRYLKHPPYRFSAPSWNPAEKSVSLLSKQIQLPKNKFTSNSTPSLLFPLHPTPYPPLKKKKEVCDKRRPSNQQQQKPTGESCSNHLLFFVFVYNLHYYTLKEDGRKEDKKEKVLFVPPPERTSSFSLLLFSAFARLIERC